MGKITLIAAFSEVLGEALAAEGLSRARSVILALPSSRVPTGASERSRPTPADTPIRAEFRPGSSISARGLFLEASAGRGPISEFIIAMDMAGGVAAGPPLLGAEPRDLDSLLDEGPRAWLQLLREATRHFRKQGAGTLAFCLSGAEDRQARTGGLSCLGAAFLHALADTCLAESTPGLPVYAFSGGSGDPAECARSVFKVLDAQAPRNAGRWTRAGKTSFLGML
jgi:hypothetical protein